MADDATQTPVDVPATTTPAASPQNPAPQATQATTQTPDPGGITDADFSHPEYGAKFKNAHSGMQKAQQEAAELKKAKATYEAQLGGVRRMVEEDPAIATSMVKYLESKGQPVPPELKKLAAKAAASQGTDEDDSRPLTKADEKRFREEIKAELGGRDAISDFMRAVGGGDVAKGSVIYHTDGAEVLKVMEEYDFPATPKHMLLAHKILTERRGPSRPATETTTPSAASDTGRATGGAPAGTPIEGVPTHAQWLAAAGFSSEEAYLRELRGG